MMHECVHVKEGCKHDACGEYRAYRSPIYDIGAERVAVCNGLVAAGLCSSVAACQAAISFNMDIGAGDIAEQVRQCAAEGVGPGRGR
jgi:hypothetical protein